ncbi:MAG TPA: nucleoside hydrolase [Candidatus Hungatella pullicola]|nr:nucleoside hydrolase [Candidatus Hungatella pullicola]
MGEERKKIIIDCDPSADDALGIMLALASDELEVVGITSVFGVCPIEQSTENAMRILKLEGREEIPVAKGAAGPLSGFIKFDHLYGGADGMSETGIPQSGLSPVKAKATEWLREKIEVCAGEITILSTGPMTNLAGLLTEYPSVREKICRILTISGSYGVRPDKRGWNPRPSWNVLADPQAASVVMESGVFIQAAGFDVTGLLSNHMTEKILEKGRKDSPRFQFFQKAVEYNLRNGLEPFSLLVDSMAVVMAVLPDAFEFMEGKAVVETEGTWMKGQTLFGTKGYLDGSRSRVRAAYSLDKEKITNLLIERLFL